LSGVGRGAIRQPKQAAEAAVPAGPSTSWTTADVVGQAVADGSKFATDQQALIGRAVFLFRHPLCNWSRIHITCSLLNKNTILSYLLTYDTVQQANILFAQYSTTQNSFDIKDRAGCSA